MNLKAKLRVGFCIMIVFAAGIAVYNINENLKTRYHAEVQSQALVPVMQASDRFSAAVFESGEDFATFRQTLNEASYRDALGEISIMEESIVELRRIVSSYPSELPNTGRSIGPMTAFVEQYKQATRNVHDNAIRLPVLYRDMKQAGDTVSRLCLEYFRQYRSVVEDAAGNRVALQRHFDRYDVGFDIIANVGEARRKMFEMQGAQDSAVQETLHGEVRQTIAVIVQSIQKIRTGTSQPEWIKRIDVLLDNIGTWTRFVDEIHDATILMNRHVSARQSVYDSLLKAAAELTQVCTSRIESGSKGTSEMIQSTLTISAVLAGLAVAAGLALAFWITRSITQPIYRSIRELSRASLQVGESGGSLAGAASTLAENTAMQAATLEETGAALEQMASVTGQNAEHARKTRTITEETIERIQSENASMRVMSEAMANINEQASKISNIIKTIEEIAFQTNLLALNAAVEAARAGEAGKGFAVVADEVRNLAGRSASAAKDTGALIGATVESVRHGAAVAERLREGFSVVSESSESIGHLVRRIAEATTEQADGVNQINMAMSRLEGVTQEISKMSMNSADSAVRLSEQTENLKNTVHRLATLVGDDEAVNGAVAETAFLSPSAAAFSNSVTDSLSSMQRIDLSKSSVASPKMLFPLQDDELDG